MGGFFCWAVCVMVSAQKIAIFLLFGVRRGISAQKASDIALNLYAYWVSKYLFEEKTNKILLPDA